MAQYNLLLISGALRKGSTNRLLLREAARHFDAQKVQEADLNLPLYDGDLEEADGVPAAVQTLADQIQAADAVVISTPEYNRAPSGVLKNALDWVSRTEGNPWQDKPVAVLSAAAGRAGGELAQHILRGFLQPFQPCVVAGPAVHLATSFQEFDDNGQLKSDRYGESLAALMAILKAEVASR